MIGSESNISEIYLERIKKHIEGKQLEQVLESTCSNIIFSILHKDLDDTSYFNFSALFRMSKLNINEKQVFADSVYILAHPNIDFIVQKFQYEASDGFWHDFDLDIIYISYKNNDFYHPVTQNKIEKEEFNDLVLPYFAPSNELLCLIEGVS